MLRPEQRAQGRQILRPLWSSLLFSSCPLEFSLQPLALRAGGRGRLEVIRRQNKYQGLYPFVQGCYHLFFERADP